MYGLQIRQYPRLYNTTITVTTVYPGASPDLIQGFITTPIEQAVATAEGIDYLTSTSIQGTSTITAYIQLNYDPSQALTDVMAKVQQVKYLMPTAGAGPDHPQGDRPDHRGHVYRLRQPRRCKRGDLGLPDPGGAAAAVDRRRRRLGRHPRRPDLRDAAVARPGAHGRARHLRRRRRRRRSSANNFQSAPGQAKGYFTVTNVDAQTGLDRCRPVQAHGGQVGGRRAGAAWRTSPRSTSARRAGPRASR